MPSRKGPGRGCIGLMTAILVKTVNHRCNAGSTRWPKSNFRVIGNGSPGERWKIDRLGEGGVNMGVLVGMWEGGKDPNEFIDELASVCFATLSAQPWSPLSSLGNHRLPSAGSAMESTRSFLIQTHIHSILYSPSSAVALRTAAPVSGLFM
ncbi:hypothetical protein HAX54_051293, partial [Datura stramonium]|nr:hypothetical protein [Datura stramonium]